MRHPLTPDQCKLFERLGFLLWKTKAEYAAKVPWEYVLAEIREGKLGISTMRGKYGCTPIRLPEDADGMTVAKELLAVADAEETDENTDLRWLLANDAKLANDLHVFVLEG